MENIIDEFISYGFLENKNNYKFETFSTTLTREDVINNTTKILKYIVNFDIEKLKVKKFLSLFLIIYFKKDFFFK